MDEDLLVSLLRTESKELSCFVYVVFQEHESLDARSNQLDAFHNAITADKQVSL